MKKKNETLLPFGPVVDRDWAAGDDAAAIPVPTDIAAQAAGRVKWVALAGVLLFGTSLAVAVFTHRASPIPTWREHFFHIHEILALALTLGIYFLTRGNVLKPQTRADLGIAMQLLVAALIGYLESDRFMEYLDWEFNPPSGGISVLCVWVMIFPILVPQSIKRTILISTLVAATLPFFAWLRSLGGPTVAWEVVAGWELPIVLSATFAVATSVIVNNLRRKVAQARLMGSYRLEKKLGQGGMGEVWRAQHRMLTRPAAVKLIRSEKLQRDEESNEQTHRRFAMEAQATAALRSPHTVELYDYGRAADGTYFYVMEYLDGIDLHNLVARFGAQPPARVAKILMQCCISLEDAHQHGLIHRDIKPANIMLCRLGPEYDFVKILDFGLVHSTFHAQQDATQNEPKEPQNDNLATDENSHIAIGDGPINGTPAYMSPEQIRDQENIDGRSDLYALGCTAYWLLTGTAVFGHGASITTLKDHLKKPPQPIEERIAGVHPHLIAVVMACLEKDPDSRPRSARDMYHALAQIQFSDPWGPQEAQSFWDAMSSAPAIPERTGTLKLNHAQ